VPHSPAHACEDEARAALLAAANSVAGAATGFGLSLRWNRSGAAGLLMAPTAPSIADLDSIDWLALDEAGADRDTAQGERAPEERVARDRAERHFHRDVYRRRQDIAAIARCGFVFSTTLAGLDIVRRGGIPAFHPDTTVTGSAGIRCAAEAVVGRLGASEQALVALDGCQACLLPKLGVLAGGPTVEAALALARQIETLAQVYWQVLQSQSEPALDHTS
jgi:L-fuculose-phosphate aldolase